MDNGAHVINYSGGGDSSSTKEQAVQYAYSNGVTIVASSGNNNGSVIWPAAYSTSYSNVIAVGATHYNDQRSFYSNYGPELNVVAPGGAHDDGYPVDPGDIYSTMPNYYVTLNGNPYYVTQNYDYLPGTSMAAPHVSGLAALILSIDAALTPSQVRTIIQETADDKGAPGRDDYYGHGRVNAYTALATFQPPAPQDLVITNAGCIRQHPHLSWDASSRADSYKVYRKTYYGNWQVIATVTNTSYTDYDVIIQNPRYADDKYYYYVTAINNIVESDPSNIVSTWGRTLEKRISGSDDVTPEPGELPKEFALSQNYPNPGNPTTAIRFQLPESRHVVLKIFNILGQEVKTLVDDYREAGTYSVIWDGRDNRGTEVPSGIYLYTLQLGDKVFTKKLTLLK